MNKRMSKIFNETTKVPITVGIFTFVTGIGLGYILGKRNPKVELHYRQDPLTLGLTEEDVAELNAIRKRHVPGILTTELEDIVEANAETVSEKVILITDPVDEPVTHSIFKDNEWDWEKEIAQRTEDAPYVLHRDEFYRADNGYTQTTLTYYAGDNIMNDEDNGAPVYNHNEVTGPLPFGHGSNDSKVVYIRNDKRKEEYEVLHDEGLYSQEVLGLEIEDNQRVKDIQHSKSLKFRSD